MEFVVYEHEITWCVTRLLGETPSLDVEEVFVLESSAAAYRDLRNTGLNHHQSIMLVDESTPCPHEPSASYRKYYR